MEKFTLSKYKYKILRELDFSEMQNNLIFFDEENSFKTDNIDLLMIIINESICAYGLDENQDCTEYGRRLYDLYDELYYKESEKS